jgi:hypothetical protein
MTQEELQSIHQKAQERIEHAKQYSVDLKIPNVDPWKNTILAKVIKTKEQAEHFMMQMEWIKNKANKK